MGVALQLAGFYVLVSIFTEGAESNARWKILVIALLLIAALNVVPVYVPSILGLILGCFAAALVSVAALVLWIKVPMSQALKITGSYIGLVLAYAILITLLFGHAV
jgi:hypothetical protein